MRSSYINCNTFSLFTAPISSRIFSLYSICPSSPASIFKKIYPCMSALLFFPRGSRPPAHPLLTRRNFFQSQFRQIRTSTRIKWGFFPQTNEIVKKKFSKASGALGSPAPQGFYPVHSTLWIFCTVFHIYQCLMPPFPAASPQASPAPQQQGCTATPRPHSRSQAPCRSGW